MGVLGQAVRPRQPHPERPRSPRPRRDHRPQGRRTPRFVTTTGDGHVLDEQALAPARRLAGLKGYVTNLPASMMPDAQVIASYHDLWHVEASFRTTFAPRIPDDLEPVLKPLRG